MPRALERLRALVSRGLTATAPLWPEIERAYAWVHQSVHLLANAEQRSVEELRQAYAALLAEMAARRDTLPPFGKMDTGVVSLPPSHRLLINGSYGEHARPVQPAPI